MATDEELEQRETDPTALVTVRRFYTAEGSEAEMAQGVLEAAGIESFLADEYANSILCFAPALGGVRLQVKKSDASTARQLLDELMSGTEEARNEGSNGL